MGVCVCVSLSPLLIGTVQLTPNNISGGGAMNFLERVRVGRESFQAEERIIHLKRARDVNGCVSALGRGRRSSA